jgi:hypothetical protein
MLPQWYYSNRLKLNVAGRTFVWVGNIKSIMYLEPQPMKPMGSWTTQPKPDVLTAVKLKIPRLYISVYLCWFWTMSSAISHHTSTTSQLASSRPPNTLLHPQNWIRLVRTLMALVSYS